MSKTTGILVSTLLILASCKEATETGRYFVESSPEPTPEPTPSKIWMVSTLAGSGTAGYEDAIGTSAQFKHPLHLSVNSSGNIYVADHHNHRIRKITAAGEVSTLAGSTAGYNDGPGAEAQFRYPHGIDVDSSGNIYVADHHNHRIRKITAAGEVSTLAGSTAGYNDGPGAEAQFHYPSDVVADSSGNIYVADKNNHRIRKITAAGEVSTLAGSTAGYNDGPGVMAKFNAPYGVAADSSGNIYVADHSNHRIRKVTAAGVVSTLAGSGLRSYNDGPGAVAMFNGPIGIAMDSSGNVYVAEHYNNRIRKIEYRTP